jgi:predicted flap endonuclease-1-like 5' DNA nuclease
MSEKDLRRIKSQLRSIEKHLNLAGRALRDLEGKINPSYEDVPGVVGVFDGVSLVTKEGDKHAVPANYAAKSKLVFGTKLKMITLESGEGEEKQTRTIFKQVGKIPAKKIEGILSRKDGKWHILSDAGSYRISDVAAEFNRVQPNDEATALIPEDNVKAPFAALLKVIRPEKDVLKPVEFVGKGITTVTKERPLEEKPAKKRVVATKKTTEPKKSAPKKPSTQAATSAKSKKTSSGVSKPKKKESTKDKTSTPGPSSKVLSDDDLR